MNRAWLGLAAACVAASTGCASGAGAWRGPGLTVPDGAGVNIHFTDARAGEVEMLARAGCRWVRMDFAWGGTEREKGVYDFAAYDRLLAALEPQGIRALLILDYSNALYDEGLSPYSDAGRQAFAAWAAAAVRHFRGRGILWEMYNEPNIGFWKPQPDPDAYVKLALAVGEAIRAAEPGEMYIGPATSGIDLPFLETCFKAGLLRHWCAVSVHPYRQDGPETAAEEYRKLRLLIAKYAPAGATIPVLSGEWGYSSVWGSFDADKQGRMLPRQWLSNLANEVPLSIWYDWHDDGRDEKEPEHHFGTVLEPYTAGADPVYSPKPAYLAARTLTSELKGFAYALRLSVGSAQDHVLLFKRGDEVRLAAWTTATTTRTAAIPASPGAFRVVGHTGEARPAVTATADGLNLTLTDAPVYLTPESPNDVLRLAAAWKRAPLETLALGPRPVTTALTLTNVLARPVRLAWGQGKAVELQPGATQEIVTTVALQRSAEPLPVCCECRVDGVRLAQESVVLASNPLTAVLLPAVGGAIRVRLENPAALPFAGKVLLTDISGVTPASTEAAVVLSDGQQEVTVPFAVSGPPAGTWSSGVRVVDPAGTTVLVLPKATCTPVADFAGMAPEALAQAFQVVPDGDAKVASTQEIALADPPEPCPGCPGRALRLTYGFGTGWKFVRVAATPAGPVAIEGQPRELGLWVFGDESGNVLRLRFVDAEGETFQPNGHRLTWKGWRYVTMRLDGRESGKWGLKSDGVVQYPIQWDTLVLLDSAGQQQTGGTVYVTAPVLVR